MSLSEILKEDQLKLIVMSDELNSCVRSLDVLIAISKIITSRCRQVIILETEVNLKQSNKEFWQEKLNFSANNIVLKKHIRLSLDSHLESLRDDLESSFDQSTLCIISSLTPLALKHSWTTIARFLADLCASPNLSNLVVNLHTDCLDNQNSLMLENFQRCVPDILLTILPSSQGAQRPNAEVRVNRRGGQKSKIFHLTISVDRDFKLSESQFKGDKQESLKLEEKEPPSDIVSTIQTTFRLNLGAAELDAKNKVKLPFWKSESSISYTPDEGDDWDEEDPDDDLNI